MAFNPKEVAEITVNGQSYRDWESVLVRDAEQESSDFFQFTCSEGKPLSRNWADVQIRPGDHCTIKLAGNLVLTGFVETRQVSYTAEQHGIQITGHSFTRALTYGSVMHKTGEFKDKSYTQIANEITKPFGIKFKPIGNVSQKKFERLNVSPGDTAWNVLETLARLRGISLGSDTEGNLTGRTQWMAGGDSLIEGQNILEGREVMSMNGGGAGDGDGDSDAHPPNYGASQQPSNDDRHGPKAAQQPFAHGSNKNLQRFGGTKGVYAPKRVQLEHPGDKDDATTRNKFENERAGVEQLQVTIVVQGWLKPSGGLWKAGDKVHVKSPMLIVDEELKIMRVEFTQDNRAGTRTSLDLARDTGNEGDPDADKHPVDYGPDKGGQQGGAQDPSDPSGGRFGHSPA
jgi:prophage tail gpP-like protein